MIKYDVTWKKKSEFDNVISGIKLTHIATFFFWVAKGYSMGSFVKCPSQGKLTILSLQIVIKCQHFINISYFYVYMHVEKLLLFKINTTCNCQY